MEAIQLSLCGKMSLGPIAATEEKIFDGYLKKQQKPPIRPLLYLDLREGSGNPLGKCWEMIIQSHGGHTTRNTGEYPNADVESSLWRILEADAPEKYSLSATGCQGILRRAEARGKELPEKLKIALMSQAGTS